MNENNNQPVNVMANQTPPSSQPPTDLNLTSPLPKEGFPLPLLISGIFAAIGLVLIAGFFMMNWLIKPQEIKSKNQNLATKIQQPTPTPALETDLKKIS